MEQGHIPETRINSLGVAVTRKIADMIRHPIRDVSEEEVLHALYFDGPEAADKLVPPGSGLLSHFRNPTTGATASLEMPVPGSMPSEFIDVLRWRMVIDVPIGAIEGKPVMKRYYMRIDESDYATSLDISILGDDVSEEKKRQLLDAGRQNLILNQDEMSEFADGKRDFDSRNYEMGQHAEIMRLLNTFKPEHETMHDTLDS